jgi:Phosphopantetheinyl transferase
MMFMLYGTSELPDIVIESSGKPKFADASLPHFSLAYAGNLVGVAITTEGVCGLDMELQRATRSFHAQKPLLSNNELLWINNQNDPGEAQTQLVTLRQSAMKLIHRMHDDQGLLQLLPGSGRLRLMPLTRVEVMCDAEPPPDLVCSGTTCHRKPENMGIR